MRKYEPIWEAIKANTNSSASLAAPIESHARIINAVRKEKAKDLGWKLQQSELGKKYRMLEKVEGKMITFWLEDISPIGLESL
jgi:hypothetical protein